MRFRISGADLVVDGTRRLAPGDLTLLRARIGAIRERLAPSPPGDDLLEEQGAGLELITDEARAHEVIAALPRTVGFDIETEPLPEHAPSPAWLAVTKDGRLAKRQPAPEGKTVLTRSAPGRGWSRCTTHDPRWST